jgi:hypothetical protein
MNILSGVLVVIITIIFLFIDLLKFLYKKIKILLVIIFIVSFFKIDPKDLLAMVNKYNRNN